MKPFASLDWKHFILKLTIRNEITFFSTFCNFPTKAQGTIKVLSDIKGKPHEQICVLFIKLPCHCYYPTKVKSCYPEKKNFVEFLFSFE